MSPLHSAAAASSEGKMDLMSTVVLTLIGSDDWSHSPALIQRAKKECRVSAK